MNLNLANPLEAVRSGADSCTSGILAGKRFGAASPDCEKGAEADQSWITDRWYIADHGRQQNEFCKRDFWITQMY